MKMKGHGSFSRLIFLNKVTVLTSIMNCLLAFILMSIKDYLFEKSTFILSILESLNIGLFTFVVFNTILYTMIFYKIVNSDNSN